MLTVKDPASLAEDDVNNGFVNPLAAAADGDGGNVVFVGSLAEHNTYNGIYGAISTDPSGAAYHYWLRAKGTDARPGLYINSTSGRIVTYANQWLGYRPMLWVKS